MYPGIFRSFRGYLTLRCAGLGGGVGIPNPAKSSIAFNCPSDTCIFSKYLENVDSKYMEDIKI